MKIRNGYVSNSSSSSFIVLKDAITMEQRDMIVNFQDWAKFFIALDEEEKWIDENGKPIPINYEQYDRLKNKFGYYDDGYWRIEEHDDFIFGDTSMDNFGMDDYFDYIEVDSNFSLFDDGWNDNPTLEQKKFIKRMKKEYRKRKLNKINNLKNIQL